MKLILTSLVYDSGVIFCCRKCGTKYLTKCETGSVR